MQLLEYLDLQLERINPLEPTMEPDQRDSYFFIIARVNKFKEWVENKIRPLLPPQDLQGRAVPVGEREAAIVVRVQALFQAPFQEANPQPVIPQQLVPQAAVLQQPNPQPLIPQQPLPQLPAPQEVNGLRPNRVSLIERLWSPLKKSCLKILTIVIDLFRCVFPFLFVKVNVQAQIQQQNPAAEAFEQLQIEP